MTTSFVCTAEHHNNAADITGNKTKKMFNIRLLATVAVVAFSLCAGSSVYAADPVPAKKSVSAKSQVDPLPGDIWHAINGTWPGTIVFDAKTKKVVLTPVGAQAIEAKYELTKLERKGIEQHGALKMVSLDGKQVVTATFVLKGRKDLSLRYASGQRDETYVRMSPAEETAERARLLKLIEEKKLGTLIKPKQ
jgi:hypothetical protein